MAGTRIPFDPLEHIEDFKLLIQSIKETETASDDLSHDDPSQVDRSQVDRPQCPHCGFDGIVKNGTKDGRQRFKCKECGHTFSWRNNTFLYSIKSDYDTLLAYCDCMMQKMTIRQCAEHCGISVPTAFEWRHKILDALQNMQDEVILHGTGESDETTSP